MCSSTNDYLSKRGETDMNKSVVVMDGTKNGFGLKVQKSGGFASKKGKPILFKSIELARVYAEKKLGLLTPYEYSIFIFIGDEKYTLADTVRYDTLLFLDINGEMYRIEEKAAYTVTKTGYFVFEDGDTNRLTDSDEGQMKYRLVFDTISRACKKFVRRKILGSIKIDGMKSITCPIKGTTYTIHFFSNQHLIKFNMERKEVGERCLPFRKEMDRYLTMYYFVTKDSSDTTAVSTDESDDILAGLIEYIRNNNNINDLDNRSIKDAPVDFVGTINL